MCREQMLKLMRKNQGRPVSALVITGKVSEMTDSTSDSEIPEEPEPIRWSFSPDRMEVPEHAARYRHTWKRNGGRKPHGGPRRRQREHRRVGICEARH